MSRLLYRLSYAALRGPLYLKTAPGATGKMLAFNRLNIAKLFARGAWAKVMDTPVF
jgi:hypothetical protein